MAGPAGGRDHTSNDPTDDFAGSTSGQFGQSYFESDLSMAAGYNMAPFSRQMETLTTSANKIGQEDMSNMELDTNGAAAASVVDPAMAPPQTPSQATFMPAGSRPSLDASGETAQDFQTGDKRKRSKASRACDECRRKKVKCDAPTEADGTPKTCTNCVKASVNCEFERKPMKRGPSKGYISALAERVQGLEQKQRQSFDAGPGGYPETFSPDEQTGPGFNRTLSFSSTPHLRGPFTSSDFNRDRMPSVGWGKDLSGSHLRSRGSGSLAIAPNETSASTVQEDELNLGIRTRETTRLLPGETSEGLSSKRQRIIGPNSDDQPFEMDATILANYDQNYHPLFALLPESEKVIKIVAMANYQTQQAFIVSLELLPELKAEPTLNGNHASHASTETAIAAPRKDLKSDAFDSFEALRDYLFSRGALPAHNHWEEEGLTLIWTMILLAIGFESNAKYLTHVTATSKTALLDMSTHIVHHRLHHATILGENGHDEYHRDAIDQVYACLRLMLRLHVLSTATAPPITPQGFWHRYLLASETQSMPIEAAYLASSFNILKLLNALVLGDQEDRTQVAISSLLPDNFEMHFALYHGYLGNSTIAKQFKAFLELCAAPYPKDLSEVGTFVPIVNTFSAVEKLANFLIQDAQVASAASRYNPLDLPAWSLATIILVGFAIHCGRRELSRGASELLDLLQVELQKKSDSFHKSYGYKWFYGGNMAHWSDALLAFVADSKSMPNAVDEAQNIEPEVEVPRLTAFMAGGFLNTPLTYAT